MAHTNNKFNQQLTAKDVDSDHHISRVTMGGKRGLKHVRAYEGQEGGPGLAIRDLDLVLTIVIRVDTPVHTWQVRVSLVKVQNGCGCGQRRKE